MYIKYKEEIFISLLVLASLLGIFLSSGGASIPMLKGTYIEPWVKVLLSGNEMLLDISIGFFVSTIFYVMIVYVPEKRRKSTIQPVINRLIEALLNRGEGVVDTIDQHAPAALKFKKSNDYSLNALKEACAAIKPNQLIDLNERLPKHLNCTVGVQLNLRENLAKQHRLKILTYLQYIDEQVVHEIDKLDSTNFCSLVTYVATPGFSPENLGFLGDAIFEYHKQLESIALIYKSKINRNYRNARYSL